MDDNSFDEWASEYNLSPELYGFTNYIRNYVRQEHGHDLPDIVEQGSRAWSHLSSTEQLQYGKMADSCGPKRKSKPKRKPASRKPRPTAAARKRKRISGKAKPGSAARKKPASCAKPRFRTGKSIAKPKKHCLPIPIELIANLLWEWSNSAPQPVDLDEQPKSTLRSAKKAKKKSKSPAK